MTEKNRVFETVTQAFVGRFKVRVWRNCGIEFKMGPDRQIQNLLRTLDGQPNINPTEILEEVGPLMDVGAVEIVDEHGNGGLLYPDWK